MEYSITNINTESMLPEDITTLNCDNYPNDNNSEVVSDVVMNDIGLSKFVPNDEYPIFSVLDGLVTSSTILTSGDFIINLINSYDFPHQVFLELGIIKYKNNWVAISMSPCANNNYIITKDETKTVLLWTIKQWMNHILEITEKDSVILWNDYSMFINKIKEWTLILETPIRFDTMNETNDDDIISTTNDVINSITIINLLNYMDVWNSSHMVAYSSDLCREAGTQKLFELSIPTDPSTIKSGDISNKLLWTHHTITNETAIELYIWFLTFWTNDLILSSSYSCKKLYLDNQKKTIEKMCKYVNMIV
jgi:hypothetical protein